MTDSFFGNPQIASSVDANGIHTQKVEVSGISITGSNDAGPTDATTLRVVQATDGTVLGPVTETVPATDTASSGLNGRLQRIAQRITSLIALVPAALTGSGNFKVAIVESTAAVTVAAGTNLNTSLLALEAGGNLATVVTDLGGVTETAPATDTASSGLNGRIQRACQRITSLIALLPASLGQKVMASSLAVSIASDQSSLPVTPAATESVLGKTVGIITNPSANFTRPTDTNVYASGDLIANSTTAGSVVALSWTTAARVAAGSIIVRRARIQKSTASVTLASFRLHLYGADPTASSGISNGDNGVWLTKVATYLGSLDVTITKAFSDGAMEVALPTSGNEINITLASGQILYGLLEARAAYVPGNQEVFTVILELHQY